MSMGQEDKMMVVLAMIGHGLKSPTYIDVIAVVRGAKADFYVASMRDGASARLLEHILRGISSCWRSRRR